MPGADFQSWRGSLRLLSEQLAFNSKCNLSTVAKKLLSRIHQSTSKVGRGVTHRDPDLSSEFEG